MQTWILLKFQKVKVYLRFYRNVFIRYLIVLGLKNSQAYVINGAVTALLWLVRICGCAERFGLAAT